MPINNRSDLKAAIIDQSHRNDVSGKVDDFIAAAEQEMLANSIERLDTRDFETRSIATMETGTRFLGLPVGFLKARRMLIFDEYQDTRPHEVSYIAPEALEIYSRPGRPSFFTVTSQFEFDRVPDTGYTVELQHWAEFTPLSDVNPENSVLKKHSNIYLFGAMWALKQWAVEFDESEYYYSKFINAIRGANLKSEDGRYGPAPRITQEGFVV